MYRQLWDAGHPITFPFYGVGPTEILYHRRFTVLKIGVRFHLGFDSDYFTAFAVPYS